MAENNNNPEENDGGLKIVDFLYLCLGKWYWFVLSTVLCLGLGIYQFLRTAPVYTRTATILIKESDKNGGSSVEDQLSQLGGFSSNKVQDEVICLQSPALTEEVVRRLHLDVNYLVDGRFHDETLYGKTQPVEVKFLSVTDSDNVSMTLTYDRNGNCTLGDFRGPRTTESDLSKTVKGKFHTVIETPVGRVLVDATPDFYEVGKPIHVIRTNVKKAVQRYNNVAVNLCDKQSNMLDLTFNDVNIERAEDVINMTIQVYNENWLADKNLLAVNTSEFIDERLRMIESELSDVDQNISSYKSENMIPDAEAAASTYMSKVEQTSDRLLDLNNQLQMSNFVRGIVANDSKKYELLPVNSGMNSASIERLIADYNDNLLVRNKQVANSNVNSPLLADLESRIASQRQVIIQSIDNHILTLKTQITALQKQENQINNKIAVNPQQTSHLTSIGREQKVKESLYIYLLQKREENELSKYYTASNMRVITPPCGSDLPTTPVKRNFLLIAFAIGLLIPGTIIYLLETLNTRIRGRRDIEGLSTPFIGEIPSSVKSKGLFHKLNIKKQKHQIRLDVAAQNTNLINEAFRMLRTNFEFVASKHGKGVVTMVTSANVSSGKTYTTSNLSAALAIKGKKVCIIDLDLRKATISRIVRSPKIGITNYLIGQAALDEVQYEVTKYPGLFIVPVGIMPPNPAEILYDERLKEAIEKLREEYDYIFLDCPPVEVVADATVIRNYADMTLFVVRAHLMERAMLHDIDKYYEEQRYPNMVLALNGTDDVYKSYSNRRYGYYRSYGYGYGNEKKK